MFLPLLGLLGPLLGGIAQGAGAGLSAQASADAQRDANEKNLQLGQETNAQNLQLTRETNALNQQIMEQQMQFQERMSSTAHQREVEDLRKAGLNPILSAGAGASAPSGSAISAQNPQMQRTTVDPVVNKGFGEGLKESLGSAMQIASFAKDLENKEAQIAVARSHSKALDAQAENSLSSALATKAEMPQIEARSKSAPEEAKLRAAQSKFDEKAVVYDGVVKRAVGVLGLAADALNVKRWLGIDRDRQIEGQRREERHLDYMGSRGSSVGFGRR